MAAVAKIDQQFGSVAEFSQTFTDMGWPTDCRQLDCGKGMASLKAFVSDTAILQRVFFEHRTQQLFSAPDGYQSFGIPGGPVSFANIGRSKLQPGRQLIHMHAGVGMEAISDPGFSGFTLSFKNSRVSELAQNLELPDPKDAKADGGVGLIFEPRQLLALKTILNQLFCIADEPELVLTDRPILQNTLETEMLTLLLAAATANPVSKVGSLSNRERALQRALEFIAAHPRDALTVEYLCIASASSISTLERAFLERYSISPKRFIKVQRLHNVRKELLQRADSRMISEVANEWGFWHMGKFAADYKNLFGYLPSQTQPDSRPLP